MENLEIPRPVVLENDPQDLRVDEYEDQIVYRWNTDRTQEPILQTAKDFHLDGPVVTDQAEYETLTDAIREDAKASNFLVVYGEDVSVSWESLSDDHMAEIGVVDEDSNTEFVGQAYQATTGVELEPSTVEEIDDFLNPVE